MLGCNRSVSELRLQTWGSDTSVSLCSVLVLVLVSGLHGKYSAFLLKIHSVSTRYGTPLRPRFLDSCKSWFIPDEHIFPQMLTGHESKPSSTPYVHRLHDPCLSQSKPCSLYFKARCVLGGAGVYGKFHSPSGEAPVCALIPWAEALGRCFFLPLLHILSFTYKWEDVRKSASEPRPQAVCFHAVGRERKWSIVSCLLQPILIPWVHWKAFHISVLEITLAGKKTRPHSTPYIAAVSSFPRCPCYF